MNSSENQVKSLKLTDGGMSTFFAGMALRYNPVVVPKLEVIIGFKLEDREENYYLIIKDDKCKAYKGTVKNPTLKIFTSADIWMKISTGELDGAMGYLKKLYTVEGDMNLLLKLNELFSEAKTQELSSQPMKNLDKIPDHRGPLNISGKSWLNIAFTPWIIIWIWYSISPGVLPLIIATSLSIIFIVYHLKTNLPTLFEIGTSIYLIIVLILFGMELEFFMKYIEVINNIFLGGLWLLSLTKFFSLTAEYTRYEFPKAIWSTRAFLKTNNILTSLWGIYFLCSAIMNLISIIYSELSIILMIVNYLLLIPMFAFTSWFQKWYPKKVIAG
jgi:putative sterol carrier protein